MIGTAPAGGLTSDSGRLSGLGQQLAKPAGLLRRQGRGGGDERLHV
jgi:hypothetical protein